MSGSKRIGRVLVDSNIFLRMFVKEDEHAFQDCQKLFTRIEQGDIAAYIPTVVVAEIAFVLSSWYRQKKNEVLKAIESIVSSSAIEVFDDLQAPLAVDLYKTYNVKLIDCLLASSKRLEQLDTAVLSYDRDFDKLGVRRLEPRDFFRGSAKRTDMSDN